MINLTCRKSNSTIADDCPTTINNNINNNSNNDDDKTPRHSETSIVSLFSRKKSLIEQFNKFHRSLTMTSCLPCTEVDPNRRASKHIDKQLHQWNRKESKVIKLLLIGAGESGKTTIIKQMKILHIQGFTKDERLEKAKEIRENIFDAIKELVSNMEYLKPPVELENSENKESLEFIKKLDRAMIESYDFPPEFFEHTKNLWFDKGIQNCYLRANEFFLIDSAKYFFDKIDEIKNQDYIPTDQDILRSRHRTSEIQKIEFEIKVPKQYGGGIQPFWMFDVGGQRGERRKWIQVFDGIRAILFVIDCSGFDTKLREDGKKNRLQESIELFEDVWFSKYLINTGFILFLNKQDILKDKIERGSRIENYFPEFCDYQLPNKNDGDANDEYTKAKCFIRDKFLDITKKGRGEINNRRNSNRRNTSVHYVLPYEMNGGKIKRECFYHFTTATDTNNIKRVFNDVHTMILLNNLDLIV